MTAPTTLAPRPRADGTEPCRADGVDPDVFFPDDEDAGLKAAAVYCRACPLIAECLAWAVDAREPGIWAATTTAQREQLRAEHGITTRLRNLTPKEIRTMTTALKPSPAAYAPGTTAAVTAELARQATAETAADTAPAAVDVPVEWKDTPAPAAAPSATAHRHGLTGSEPPSVADVIAAARATGDAKLATQADKAETAVAALMTMVGEHQALVRAEADVERLAAELAAAKAKVRGIKQCKTTPKDSPAASGAAVRRHAVDPKAVRAWAAESGVECNAHGIVRHDVVDAYLAAQPATEASA